MRFSAGILAVAALEYKEDSVHVGAKAQHAMDDSHPVLDDCHPWLVGSYSSSIWVLSLRELYLKPSLIYAELTL